jgi:tRNA pseudouridine55 synthase
MTTEASVDGLLLVDKPCGPTSHDVVAAVRTLTGQRHIGHAGTLDPMASGLLPLVLGRATRLVAFLPRSPKVYEGRVRLGVTTTTDDTTGSVLSRHAGPAPDLAEVLRACERFRGRFPQTPPRVSALKVGGRRLYRLAREGRAVSPRPRDVEVYSLVMVATEDPAEWAFTAQVSPGTYLRAIARDLGEALGTGGALSALRRIAIGPLSVSCAATLPRGTRDGAELLAAVVPIDLMPLEVPAVRLIEPAEVRRFRAGMTIDVAGPSPPDGPCRVTDPSGALLGIGIVSGGRARPKVVLPGNPESGP